MNKLKFLFPTILILGGIFGVVMLVITNIIKEPGFESLGSLVFIGTLLDLIIGIWLLICALKDK